MKKRKNIIIAVIGAIINQEKKFLLTKRVHLDDEDYKSYHNAWQLPGGGLEFGESPEETLHREMKEELGSDIEIISLLPKIYTKQRKNYQLIFIVYLCRLKNKKAKIKLNNEASDYHWYTFNQVLRLKRMAGTLQFIKDALSLYKSLKVAKS